MTVDGLKLAVKGHDFIVRRFNTGPSEEFVMSKEHFFRQYESKDKEEASRFPIDVTDPELVEVIENAKVIEWTADHWRRKYQAKMVLVWKELSARFNLDHKNHLYALDDRGEGMKIYYGEALYPKVELNVEEA